VREHEFGGFDVQSQKYLLQQHRKMALKDVKRLFYWRSVIIDFTSKLFAAYSLSKEH